MTRKHLKMRIRARMARTGERYVTARRHVLGADAPAGGAVRDGGYVLRGGVHPDTAAIANVLAHHSAGGPLTEGLVLCVGGGLGAGYILWEFAARDAPILVLGFRNQWQYPARWLAKTLERLGVPADVHETGSARAAARALDAALAEGRPAIAWIDRQEIGYWHLPGFLSGVGGYPVVVYAAEGDRVRVDDRTLAPLSVPRPTLDAARARVGSYKHRLAVLRPDAPLDGDRLREAVATGLVECVDHLDQRSDSFSLPAWRKWARMLTDTGNAKAWPNVFADGRGLVGALLSTYEGIEPIGTDGGHLRGLFADGLDEAAALLERPALTAAAGTYREAAARWHALAEAALPTDVPVYAALRERLAAVHQHVLGDGDAGANAAAGAARELWELRARHDADPVLDHTGMEALLAQLAGHVEEAFEAEVTARDALREALA